MLTLLDLGGIALRTADRAEDATLVLVGGPTASHPEPMSAFFDAAFVGEAEEQLPELVVACAAMRREIRAGKRTRRDALAELASRFPLYVPSLYDTVVDEATGMTVVGGRRCPARPQRRAARWRPSATSILSRGTGRCRTPRPCSSVHRSRSRAAAPRAAG